MFWKKKKSEFEPDLIDLVEYEKTLLYRKKHGKPAISVMPWPSGDWSDSELQYMRDNRARAREIKKEIYGE